METQRINIHKIKPNVFHPLYDLNKQLLDSTLSLSEYHLIKLRASQINACAFCIQMYVRDAIENGETQYRIHALSTWEETDFFSEEEKIMLKVVEELTLVHQEGLRKETYTQALQAFGEQKVIDIIMAIVNINAWNRIARATLMIPQAAQA